MMSEWQSKFFRVRSIDFFPRLNAVGWRYAGRFCNNLRYVLCYVLFSYPVRRCNFIGAGDCYAVTSERR